MMKKNQTNKAKTSSQSALILTHQLCGFWHILAFLDSRWVTLLFRFPWEALNDLGVT
jgi:hypothetical protein